MPQTTWKFTLPLLLITLAFVGLDQWPRAALAEEHSSSSRQAEPKEANSRKNLITIEVVLEDVDLAANTVTARAVAYVIPPHDRVGGAVFLGADLLPPGAKATRFSHLPVMPQAQLQAKGLKAGMRATLRVEVIPPGTLVVVGIDKFLGVERIGVEWLDAPAPNHGK
ncbi:MAG: hypothetical protein JO112_17605 [Planctomycetes bacterium]|nr:hypothetical protein [Planctomycetota bacterium]